MNFNMNVIRLNLKKYKKSYSLLSAVIILACIFVFLITIYNDSLIKTEEQQRKDIYGSWHVAVYNSNESLYKDLRNHATILSIGKMIGYGNVLNKGNEVIGSIGAIEDNTNEMGLSLLDGKFPENGKEIAVEMSYLSMLGYSYELGQEIQLKIQVYDKKSKKTEEIVRTYTLSGVLKNYSTLWKKEGGQLISFLVKGEDFGETSLYENIFCILKKEYEKNADELAFLTTDRGNYIKNDYTYYNYALKSEMKNDFLSGTLFITLVAFTAILFIFNIFNTSLKEHSKSFVVMRCLGASKNQITTLYFIELLFVLTVTFAIGIVLGLLLSLLGYYIIKIYFIQEFVFHINVEKLTIIMLFIIFQVLLFALISIFSIRKVTLTGNVVLQPGRTNKIKPRLKLKPLTVRQMIKIFNQAHRKETIIYFLFTLGTFIVLASTSYRAYQKNIAYSYLKNTYTADYEFGDMIADYEPMLHIEEKELQQIKQIYGIDYIRAYRCSKFIPLSWEGIGESKYADYLEDNYFPQYANNKHINASMVGISNNKRDYNIFIDNLDQGKMSYEKFIRGKEVIIYLPTIYQTRKGNLLKEVDYKHNAYEKIAFKYTEKTIKVGDEIKIEGEQGEVVVKIGGIINSFEKGSSATFLSKPYSIICSNELYDRLTPNKDRKTFEFLQIYANSNANYERTDVELSKIKNNIFIVNYRLQKEELRNNAMVSIIGSYILGFIAIFITIIIQYNNQTAKRESDYLRNNILSMLGMNKWKIRGINLYNIVKYNIISVVIVFLAIQAYQTRMYFYKVGFSMVKEDFFLVIPYIYKVYFGTMPWLYIIVFVLGYLAINILITYYPLVEYRKMKK